MFPPSAKIPLFRLPLGNINIQGSQISVKGYPPLKRVKIDLFGGFWGFWRLPSKSRPSQTGIPFMTTSEMLLLDSDPLTHQQLNPSPFESQLEYLHSV